MKATKKLAGLFFLVDFVCGANSNTEAVETGADKVAAGHNFALAVCAACHQVAKDQSSKPLLNPPAPSFTMIAQRTNLTEAVLRQFLSSTHGNAGSTMPNPQLVDYQVDELIAYILSLRTSSEKHPSNQ